MSAPAVGERFPRLELETVNYQKVRVPDDFAGRNVVLSWFPVAFSPVCTQQLTGFNQLHKEFTHLNAVVVAVSCDHWYSAEAYKAKLGAQFPFYSDWSKENARTLGILNPERGYSRRAVYLLDKDGVLRWQRTYEPGVCPTLDDFAPELKKLA